MIVQTTLRQIEHWLGIPETPSRKRLETKVTGVSTDTRTLQKGDLYVPLIGERFDGHDFVKNAVQAGAKAILCQEDRDIPELDCPVIKVPDTLQALQRLAKGYRRVLDIPVIAVTGSNGKTTTKDLIASALAAKFRVHKTKGNLNNHIGLPLTLLSIPAETDVAVLEMGMNHQGEIALLSQIAEPNMAVITNIGDAHIAFFDDQRGIAQAKLEILAGLKSEGALFINGDDPLLCAEAQNRGANVSTVGLGENVNEKAIDLETVGMTTWFTATNDGLRYAIPMLGQHNVINALFAIAVGRQLGLAGEEMFRGLKDAELSGRRLQVRKTARGMWIIDDSYNANPTAVRAGIQTLTALTEKSRKWVLLGDILELGEQEEAMHRALGEFTNEQNIDRVFTIGERARWIHEAAMTGRRSPGTAIHFDSIDEAIEELRRRENPDTVLLIKASRGMALDRVVDALLSVSPTD